MSFDIIQEKIEKMSGDPSAYSTEELQAALREAAQCEEKTVDEAWIAKHIGAIQNDLLNRGINSSTCVVLRNEAYRANQEDIYVEAVLQWGLSPISKKHVHSGGSTELNCEYVWYDLYIYDAGTSALLTKKLGIYGDSAWRFVNDGNGFAIVK